MTVAGSASQPAPASALDRCRSLLFASTGHSPTPMWLAAREAVAQAETAGDERALVAARTYLMLCELRAGSADTFEQTKAGLLETAQRLGEPHVAWLVRVADVQQMALSEHFIQAVNLGTWLARTVPDGQHPIDICYLQYLLADALRWCGRNEQSQAYMRLAKAQAERTGFAYARLAMACNLADSMIELQLDAQGALQMAQDMHAQMLALPACIVHVAYLNLACEALYLLGRFDEACALTEQMLALPGVGPLLDELAFSVVLPYIGAGRLSEAQAWIDKARRRERHRLFWFSDQNLGVARMLLQAARGDYQAAKDAAIAMLSDPAPYAWRPKHAYLIQTCLLDACKHLGDLAGSKAAHLARQRVLLDVLQRNARGTLESLAIGAPNTTDASPLRLAPADLARLQQVEAAIHQFEQLLDAKAPVGMVTVPQSTVPKMLRQVAHDMRTPAANIKSLLVMLRRGPPPAANDRLLKLIDLSADNLMALVNDVLDLACLEKGVARLQFAAVDLQSLLSDSVEAFRVIASSRGLWLHVRPDQGCWPAAITDGDRVRQVLNNLVSNALKFTREGGIEVSWTLLPSEGGQAARVEVTDTGAGIAPADLGRLFREFSQVQPDSEQARAGCGLGLAICRQIVHALGGRIGVDSRVGVGSTFWFELPLLRPAVAAQSAPARA